MLTKTVFFVFSLLIIDASVLFCYLRNNFDQHGGQDRERARWLVDVNVTLLSWI